MQIINNVILNQLDLFDGIGYRNMPNYSQLICVDKSIFSLMALTNTTVLNDDMYKYYSIIRSNYLSGIKQLNNLILETDVSNFSNLKSIVRNSIEAYIDMFNWYNDPDYREVIAYPHKNEINCNEEVLINKFGKPKNRKTFFSLSEKLFIAKEKFSLNECEFNYYKGLSGKYNHYVHPNIWISNTDKVNELKECIDAFLNLSTSALNVLSLYCIKRLTFNSSILRLHNKYINDVNNMSQNLLGLVNNEQLFVPIPDFNYNPYSPPIN